MFSTAYSIIHANPDIDTPLLCLYLHEADILDPDIRGTELATWLSEWHREAWEETCVIIDAGIDEGMITFSDDGELRATGC